MTSRKNKVILIVGAGPVGLSLAVLLRQMEIPFRIIDKKTESLVYTRAISTHSRTLEIFKQMNILNDVKSKGRVTTLGVDMYHDGQFSFRVKLPPSESSEPYLIGLIQSKTEEIIYNRLKELGVEIEYGVELKYLHKNGDQVEYVEVSKSNGQTERISTEFLIGCDGGHSNVRKLSGIPFVGDDDIPINLTAVDINVKTDIPKEVFGSVFIRESRMVGFIWVDDTTLRLIIPNLPGDNDLDLKASLNLMKKNISPINVEITKVNWFNTFKVHERRAEHHFSGNVYLCGDAAHTHSPAGGQGLNTGIQDAYNLAWKLAYIHKGIGIASVLNQSFDDERSAVAEMVLKSSGAMIRNLITPVSGYNRFLINYVFPFAMSFNHLKHRASNSMSEVHLKYEKNDLVRDIRPGLFFNSKIPGVGLRLPPFDLFCTAPSGINNTHAIITGGYCFEIFLYIPEKFLDLESSVPLNTITTSLMSSLTWFQPKEKTSGSLPFYKLHFIIATKMFQPDQWSQQIDNPSATEMQYIFNSSSTCLDINHQIGNYFQFPINQISLFIVRPDAVVGLSEQLTTNNCQSAVNGYFSRFMNISQK